MTVLHKAAEKCLKESVKILIEHGSNVHLLTTVFLFLFLLLFFFQFFCFYICFSFSLFLSFVIVLIQ